MQNFRNSVALRFASVLTGVALMATGAMASSHVDKRGLRAPKTGIDMIITGANNGSLKRKNLDPALIDKGDCPLCYHRELLKKNNNSLPKNLQQPFPGE